MKSHPPQSPIKCSAVRGIEPWRDFCLVDWRLLAIPFGITHLIGRPVQARRGLLSGGIVRFDFQTGRAQTEAGEAYQLIGPHGYSADAEIAWWAWASTNGVSSSTDVTQVTYSLMLSAGFDPKLEIAYADLPARVSSHVVY